MTILRAKYPNRSDLLGDYQATGPCGALFVSSKDNLNLGCAVIVDVWFPQLRSHMLLRGYVSRGPSEEVPARFSPWGVLVTFFESEVDKIDHMLRTARDPAAPIDRRRDRRLPVTLDVRWHERGKPSWQTALIEDICKRGAFIRTDESLPVGTAILLEIHIPETQSMIPIEAIVVHEQRQPQKRGLGLIFASQRGGARNRIKEMIRRIERPVFEELLDGIGKPVDEFSDERTIREPIPRELLDRVGYEEEEEEEEGDD